MTVITGGVVNEMNAMRTSRKRLDQNHGVNDMDHATSKFNAWPRETSITAGLDHSSALSSESGRVSYFAASPAFLAFGSLSCTNPSGCCPPFRFQPRAHY